MSNASTPEEKRAELIIKYRNFKKEKKTEEGNTKTYWLKKKDDLYIMSVLIDQSTIGIAFIRELRDLVKKEDAVGGILIGDGKYTYSARSSAPKMNIELIPSSIPIFDIFEHELVPRQVILNNEEKAEIIKKYHAEPFQFPWIKSTDPISIILGAKPGDIIKIIQKSSTAGIYESYRYVVA